MIFFRPFLTYWPGQSVGYRIVWTATELFWSSKFTTGNDDINRNVVWWPHKCLKTPFSFHSCCYLGRARTTLISIKGTNFECVWTVKLYDRLEQKNKPVKFQNIDCERVDFYHLLYNAARPAHYGFWRALTFDNEPSWSQTSSTPGSELLEHRSTLDIVKLLEHVQSKLFIYWNFHALKTL